MKGYYQKVIHIFIIVVIVCQLFSILINFMNCVIAIYSITNEKVITIKNIYVNVILKK